MSYECEKTELPDGLKPEITLSILTCIVPESFSNGTISFCFAEPH